MLTAYHALGDWLTGKPRTTTLPEGDVPLEVISPSWEPHVRDRAANRAGYACCVLDALRTRLRRRDVYPPASSRWGDPRAELLAPDAWEDQREALCDELALDTDPAAVLAQLTATLDAAWMTDTHTVFAQTLIPGTQRDSLYTLDGLLANQTLIRPEMVSTDTAGSSEIVFALARTLGYRWAPRLADLPDQRL